MVATPENFFLGLPSAAAHRNEFRSVQELIDRALFSFDLRAWPDERIRQFRAGLEHLAKSVIDETARAFQRGSERGIEQTAEILADPEYYRVTKKKNAATRREQLKRSRERRADEDQARYSPSTPAQIAARRAHLIWQRDWHQLQTARYTAELAEFDRTAGASLDLAKSPTSGVRQ